MKNDVDAPITHEQQLVIEIERLRAQLSACEFVLANAETERDMANYEVSRLRAERDTLNEKLMACEHILYDAETERDMNLAAYRELIVAIPTPPQADDRLAWATAGAKSMRVAAMTALAVGPYEEGSDEYAIIAALDPAAVARHAVDDKE